MTKFTDQMGRKVALPHYPPRRIVSLVPSQTELLFHLGLEERLVGVTKFCVRPHGQVAEKAKIGGTKTLNIKRIEALNPDLIIGNKEENDAAQINELTERYPVWMSDVNNLLEAMLMIRGIGEITGTEDAADQLSTEISTTFGKWQAVRPPTRLRVAYFIWRKPYMVAAGNTFIDAMLEEAGFENIFQEMGRYPEIQPETLIAASPDCVFLSSEPYPFTEKHVSEFREWLPSTCVRMVDGEMFSWYGSRLLHAPEYFRSLRHSVDLLKIGLN